MRILGVLVMATTAVAVGACDDGDNHDHVRSAIVAGDVMAGCNHFEFGPHHDGFAASAAAMDAPLVMPHNDYRLVVPEGGGYVKLRAPSDASYYLMLGAAGASVSLSDTEGAAVDPVETQTPAADCAAAAALSLYTLRAGHYLLHVTGATATQLVVHGPVGGDHAADAQVHEHAADAGHEHAADAGDEHHAADAG